MHYHYEAFRAQVNPHFLFNSLNMLMDIIETDREKAGQLFEIPKNYYLCCFGLYCKAGFYVRKIDLNCV